MNRLCLNIFVLSLLLFYSSIINLKAQNLSIYSDYLDRVYVFDNGQTKQIEHLPIKSYKIGDNAIAYEDNTGNFKVYQNNYLHKISSFVNEYI
ncbi:MAG: hypothetical protein GX879_02905, partial [Bacteroidales bacterium]|nr:hypothetical protein [Bacteroidales bacterium]